MPFPDFCRAAAPRSQYPPAVQREALDHAFKDYCSWKKSHGNLGKGNPGGRGHFLLEDLALSSNGAGSSKRVAFAK